MHSGNISLHTSYLFPQDQSGRSNNEDKQVYFDNVCSICLCLAACLCASTNRIIKSKTYYIYVNLTFYKFASLSLHAIREKANTLYILSKIVKQNTAKRMIELATIHYICSHVTAMKSLLDWLNESSKFDIMDTLTLQFKT